MYKALILDMDGTVMDTRQMVYDSLAIFLAGYGVPLTEALKRRAFSMPSDDFIASLKLGEDTALSARKRREIEIGMADRISLFPGIGAVLTAPVRRGIVTSQVRDELELNLANLGIADRFEFAVCADELPERKPSPAPLSHCLAHMGVAPADALYVGDTPHDLACARDAGVDFGLAAWGAEEGMNPSGARYIFTRPEELLEHITTGGVS